VPINPVPFWPFRTALNVKYLRTVATQLWFWPLLLKELLRADVVHVFSASYSSFLLSTLPAVVVAKALGKPVILNYHSGEAPDHLRRSAVARWIMRDYVDANVVPSKFLRDVLASFDIPAHVVTNTIDRDRFRYRVRTPLTPRILSTRNFEPIYNLPATVRAFARVQARFPDASLMLVGYGSEESAICRLVAELNLRNVTFAGRVSPDRIHEYYAAADIYVQTPRIDNMPLSVLEAFASGLPVVSTRTGGVPAILASGVHGLLADDEDSVSAAIITLLESADLARELAANAHATCPQYDWGVARDKWLTVYRGALHRGALSTSAQSA
jgi:glycosyltransferase involved in cell wall biosynthesis